jgi:hypothetical protein
MSNKPTVPTIRVYDFAAKMKATVGEDKIPKHKPTYRFRNNQFIVPENVKLYTDG